MKRIPLLMTASVSTRGMKGACFTDAEREAMYVGALNYYITNILSKQPEQRIVFAENSGWNVESIKRQLEPHDISKIEFISLPPEDFDISRGKGYNEMLMINKATEQSTFINNAHAFFKVTGRYPVYNMDYFLRKASCAIYEHGYDIYCDMKDHKLYDRLHLGWNGHSFECRLFAVTTSWYSAEMADTYKDCNDYNGNLLETVLFRRMKTAQGKKSIRFKREPHFGGLEGSNVNAVIFSKNQDSAKGKLKRLVGNMIRTFTPWFKF